MIQNVSNIIQPREVFMLKDNIYLHIYELYKDRAYFEIGEKLDARFGMSTASILENIEDPEFKAELLNKEYVQYKVVIEKLEKEKPIKTKTS